MSYNGWSNYETWAVALWIDNEQGSQEWAVDLACEVVASETEHPRSDLADRLHEELDAEMPNLGASMFSDLLNAAWGEVDWRELAGHYLLQAEEVRA